MYTTAIDRLNKGDIEQAYVTIMKYLSVVSFIQRTSDYNKDPAYYKAMMGKKPQEALNLAEELNSTLAEGYKNLKNEEEENKENASISTSNTDAKPAEPSGLSEKKGPKLSMTSAGLFNYFRDGESKVLVMDARPSEYYNDSRILTKNNSKCINIPEEIIDTG